MKTPRTLDELFPDAYSWLDSRLSREARSRVLGAPAPAVYLSNKPLARLLRALARIFNRRP